MFKRKFLVIISAALMLTLCGCGGQGESNIIKIAKNGSGGYIGLNKGGTLIKDEVNGTEWTEGGKWIVEPRFQDIIFCENQAGAFYLASADRARYQTYLNCTHIFDKDGKLVKQFPPNEVLYQASGDIGIVYRDIPNPFIVAVSHDAFLFSFKTLQPEQAIGKEAFFIKNGMYIEADGEVWKEELGWENGKVTGGIKRQRRFYDRDGRLIWEGTGARRIDSRNDENDPWVVVQINYQSRYWLNLISGAIIPQVYGVTEPPEEFVESLED
jgi:hypothetical protein